MKLSRNEKIYFPFDIISGYISCRSVKLVRIKIVKKFEKYEQVALYLLDKFKDEFGLEEVQGKQSVIGIKSGTKWTIDGKAICEGNEAFLVVECKRYTTSKIKQDIISSVAYRIMDTRALGGIVVSPLGFQSGAKKIANKENIIEVHLSSESDNNNYLMSFLNQIKAGVSETVVVSDSCRAVISRKCEKCRECFELKNNEKLCPKCVQ